MDSLLHSQNQTTVNNSSGRQDSGPVFLPIQNQALCEVILKSSFATNQFTDRESIDLGNRYTSYHSIQQSLQAVEPKNAVIKTDGLNVRVISPVDMHHY